MLKKYWVILMTERYILITDDEYCYTLDTLAEDYKTLEDFEKAEFKQAEKDGVDINDYEDAILESANDKYWDWVYNTHIEADTCNDIMNELYEENEILKNGLSDDGLTIADLIKQNQELSLDLQIYKQKVEIILQKYFDKYLDKEHEDIYLRYASEIVDEIAEKLGVELE